MGLELFGGGPSAACSAEATIWWLLVLVSPAPGGAGGWCRLTEPSHSCWEASHARRAWGKSVVDPRTSPCSKSRDPGRLPRDLFNGDVDRADRRRMRYRLVGPIRQVTSLLDAPTRLLPQGVGKVVK